MRWVWLSIFLCFFLLAGCSKVENTISEKEVRKQVIRDHTKDLGVPKITSVKIEGNLYIIKWRNRENRESGTDKIGIDGKVKTAEVQFE